MKQKYFLFSVMVLLTSFFLQGCNGDKNKIGEAQICIDRANEANTAEIQGCIDKISGLNSPDANTVRCSGMLLLGGLTTSKIINASSAAQGGQAIGDAQMMLGLAVTNSDKNTNISRAAETLNACKASGISGLIWIAGFSNLGTVLVNNSALCSGSPSSCETLDATSAQNIMNQCNGGGSSCDPSTVGSTAIIIAGTHCTGDNEKKSECKKLQDAINAGGGDPSIIGESILDQFDPTP